MRLTDKWNQPQGTWMYMKSRPSGQSIKSLDRLPRRFFLGEYVNEKQLQI